MAKIYFNVLGFIFSWIALLGFICPFLVNLNMDIPSTIGMFLPFVFIYVAYLWGRYIFRLISRNIEKKEKGE